MSDLSISLGVTGKDAVLGAFSQVSSAGKQMGETFGSIAGKLAGLAAGYVSITAAIGAFHSAMEEGGRLADFSDQTGIAVGKLVLLERAFENNGLAADDLGKVINKMQKFLISAGEAGTTSAEQLHKIGLFSSDLLQLSPDEQFQKIAQTVAGIQDPALKASVSMEIFGKSGGKLMALFKDMPGEIAQAKNEVGTYADIMDKNAKTFDALGDGITEIGHKLMEFAAGALTNVGGGLKEFIDLIKNFDAAGFGKKVTSDISSPIQAIADSIVEGKFKQAFEVAYELVKLQGMKMGNTLMAAFDAAVAGIYTLFSESFGEDSKIPLLLKQSFRTVSLFITKEILEALANVVSAIPGIGKEFAEGLTAKAQLAGNMIANSFNVIKNVAGEAGKQFENATAKAFDTAQNVYKISDGYFDISTQQEKVQVLSEKIKSDHESMVTLTAAIAANGKKFEESIVGSEVSFSKFKSKGGEAGSLAEMSGLNVPEKTFAATGLGPIDTPQQFSTKIVSGTPSTSTKDRTIWDQAKELLSSQDWANNRLSISAGSTTGISNAIQTRAEQKASSNMSYYTGGDSNASFGQATQDLASKLWNDTSGLSKMDATKQAEQMMSEEVNKVKGPSGSSSSGGSGGGSSSAAAKDPVSEAMGGVKEIVKKIYEHIEKSLPQHALT